MNSELARQGQQSETTHEECDEPENPFIYLYTTAGPKKQNYRRGILDALCYPNNHIIQYRYRLQEIAPEVLQLSNAENLPAVIIFVDSFKSEGGQLEVNHYPLRLCQITRMPPFSVLKSSPLQRRVDFSLKLGDFVYYDPAKDSSQWHGELLPEEERRKVKGSSNRYFVIAAPNRFSSNASSLPPSDTWETLTQFVSRSAQMSNAVFLRLGDLVELGEDAVSPGHVKPYFGGALNAYPVKPSKEYRLDITVFDSPYTKTGLGDGSELEIKVSSDQVYVSQPFHSVVSGLVERSTILSCKRTTEELFTTVSLSVKGSQPGTTTNSPVLALRTKPSWWQLAGFVALVAIGALTLSIDVDTAKWLWCEKWHEQQDSIGAFVLLLKMMGLIAVAVAAFIAYRKFPQPGKD